MKEEKGQPLKIGDPNGRAGRSVSGKGKNKWTNTFKGEPEEMGGNVF